MALKLTLGKDDIFITTDGLVAKITEIKREASGRPVIQLSIVAPSTTAITRIMSAETDTIVDKKIEVMQQWTSYPAVEKGLTELLWDD